MKKRYLCLVFCQLCSTAFPNHSPKTTLYIKFLGSNLLVGPAIWGPLINVVNKRGGFLHNCSEKYYIIRH